MKKPYIKPQFITSTNVDQPHVYCIMNKVNAKIYVGVHNGNYTATYKGSSAPLDKAYEKYGYGNFGKVILKQFDTVEEAYSYEEEIVDLEFIARKDTYNIQTGGSGFRPETQAKAVKLANEYHKANGYKNCIKAGKAAQKTLKKNKKCSFHNEELQRKSAEKAWAALKADGYSKSEAKKQATCPHCDKTGNAMAMKRWHFDNCKNK